MARRPPGVVRAALPRRLRPDQTLSIVDGLSARTISEIQLIERSAMYPGAVGRALQSWKRDVNRNIVELIEEVIRHGCPCCDPTESRAVIEEALARVRPRARRELRAWVEPLDETFRRRTIHDPATPPERPWWHRRA